MTVLLDVEIGDLVVVCGSGAKYAIRGGWREHEDTTQALSAGTRSMRWNINGANVRSA